jgi:membrane fusion protein, multidrug efflux system
VSDALHAAGGRDDASRRARRRLVAALAAVVLIAVLGAAALVLARRHREAAERDRLAREAVRGPRVLVTTVERPSGARTLTLPGDLRAFEQATVYAKVNGYVAAVRVDKGDRVRKDQVLARISSPETDQQVRAASATLAVAERNAARARRLAPHGVVSQQELDQAVAALRVARSDHQRALALQQYEVVRAPFDGVVTARYVDPGALLTATATGQPVVDVATEQQARIFVYVSQEVAPYVRIGDAAEVAPGEIGGAPATAHVRRIAEAIDPRTRSMLAEVWLDDAHAFRVLPGMFVRVSLHVQLPPLPAVPADALIARGERLQVALVRDGRLHFVDVRPGVDEGATVQIREGLAGGELIAVSPPSDLGEGAPVQPTTRQQVRRQEQATQQHQGGGSPAGADAAERQRAARRP